jgi:hypothetical protein
MKVTLIKKSQKAWALLLVLLLLVPGEVFANYRAAQASYAKQDYTRAAAAFFQSYSYPKDRAEKFKAEWGLAESLKNLNLLYASSKYYSVIVRRGPGKGNPFFTKALEELGKINSTLSIGQSHIVQLFKTKVAPEFIPGAARGFYFYYRGVEAFGTNRFEIAEGNFKRVPSSSPYFLGAQFHLGVIANIAGNRSRAIPYFERVLSGQKSFRATQEMREMAIMNIARVHYENKDYRRSIEYYAQIPRDSDNWLEIIWEASWAFFLMQKHNNTLGNIHTIHSPFFSNRFYPESYILQAITFLRLCRYTQTKESLRRFRDRYKAVFDDVRAMLTKYKGDYKGFFKLVYDYRVGSLDKYDNARAILDNLSRTDNYKEAGDTIRFADAEVARLQRYSSYWKSSGLESELLTFMSQKKSAAQDDAGRRIYKKGAGFYSYLKELSDQTGLIQAEMLEGKLVALRSKINVGNADKKVSFIGGMQELNVSQDLEYWPFEGEYWEDELGGYVYNIDSKCNDSGSDEEKE